MLPDAMIQFQVLTQNTAVFLMISVTLYWTSSYEHGPASAARPVDGMTGPGRAKNADFPPNPPRTGPHVLPTLPASVPKTTPVPVLSPVRFRPPLPEFIRSRCRKSPPGGAGALTGREVANDSSTPGRCRRAGTSAPPLPHIDSPTRASAPPSTPGRRGRRHHRCRTSIGRRGRRPHRCRTSIRQRGRRPHLRRLADEGVGPTFEVSTSFHARKPNVDRRLHTPAVDASPRR